MIGFQRVPTRVYTHTYIIHVTTYIKLVSTAPVVTFMSLQLITQVSSVFIRTHVYNLAYTSYNIVLYTTTAFYSSRLSKGLSIIILSEYESCQRISTCLLLCIFPLAPSCLRVVKASAW